MPPYEAPGRGSKGYEGLYFKLDLYPPACSTTDSTGKKAGAQIEEERFPLKGAVLTFLALIGILSKTAEVKGGHGKIPIKAP